MQPWTKAVVFGAISAALIVLIYATPSPEPGFAGANFGYNVSFFFPIMILSFVFWGVALGFYIAFLRDRAGKSPLKIVSPPILLIPFTLQAIWIIRLLLLLRERV
jgi:amino acid permease